MELRHDYGCDKNETDICTCGADDVYHQKARIAELEAEVERLTALNDGNKEIAGKLVVEKFDLLGKIETTEDTAWNDAIEAAATVKTDQGYDLVSNVTAAAIRALSKPHTHDQKDDQP